MWKLRVSNRNVHHEMDHHQMCQADQLISMLFGFDNIVSYVILLSTHFHLMFCIFVVATQIIRQLVYVSWSKTPCRATNSRLVQSKTTYIWVCMQTNKINYSNECKWPVCCFFLCCFHSDKVAAADGQRRTSAPTPGQTFAWD